MWRSPLPELSDRSLSPGEPMEAGIYALLLPPEGPREVPYQVGRPVILAESTLVVQPDGDGPPTLDPDNSYLIPRRWPDSVKAGFAAAFADYAQRARRPHPVSRLALVDPQVRFGPPSPAECMDNRTPGCAPIRSWLSLSPLGFNADSTYAVAYRRDWCGPICGSRIVFLFRRQADKQWILWSASVLAVS
jgi:hypothetical protein